MLLTGTADLSCSLGQSPSPTSGRAACGSKVLLFSGSDGCPSELQSPLCTCGVLLVSPASSPDVSSSSAPQSSPTRDGPARFSRARDVEDWQLPVDRGVSCALLAWFFAGHHRSWWFTLIPCLPALVRVIIVAVVIPTSLSTSRPAYTAATCASSTAITCPACGFLAHSGSVCQLQALTVRGVFVPVDFGHWDLLSMLLLEVGDEFSHLVGTPTFLCKSFLQRLVSNHGY